MAEQTYRIIAPQEQVDAAGVPPRPPSLRAANRMFWDIPDTELADLPALRQWLREHEVAAYERGEAKRAETPPGGAEPYLIVTGMSWTSWKGPDLTRLEPCAGCGLNFHVVTPPPPEVPEEEIDDVLDKLAEVPICSLSGPSSYVVRPDLLQTIRLAGLDGGLASQPLDRAGRAVLIWSTHALGGPAYRYGPTPCAVCGRAVREVDGEEEFTRPNYAYGLTFEAKLDHWSWSTLYGQQTPLISHAVAEFLQNAIPTLSFIPHGRPDDPGAFLPEPYRR